MLVYSYPDNADKTYQLSHERWAVRHRLGASWHSLGNYLEYSLRFAQLTDKEPRCSRIAFRSKEERLQQVELVFEAIAVAYATKKHYAFMM